MFALHIIQAEEGDSLLLQSGRSFVLVDGGPADTWNDHLRPALKQLGVARLDLVVVSHVDGDHVTGLIDLLQTNGSPAIDGVWHNAFSRQVGDAIEDLVVQIVAPEPARSIAQGSSLAGLIGETPLNAGFAGGLVSVESAGRPSAYGELTLQVVAPDARALQALRDDWSKWIAENSKPTARGKARPDRSVTNRSSIVLLARQGTKSMLLTGDARWDEVLDGLESAGALDGLGRLRVDVLKVQHHGSRRNATREFFERVVADTYVVSANGRYDNPDVDTLLWIVDAAQKRPIRIIVTNVSSQVRNLVAKRPPREHGYSLLTIRADEHFITVAP